MSLKLNQHILLIVTLPLLLNSPDTLWGQTSASQPVTSSGKEFMVPKKEVNGKLVGQEDVLIQEVVVTDSGRRYRRLDVGVSGTVDGWTVKEDSAFQRRQFGSAPEFTFTQVGNVYRRFHGIVRYEASKGMGGRAFRRWRTSTPATPGWRRWPRRAGVLRRRRPCRAGRSACRRSGLRRPR